MVSETDVATAALAIAISALVIAAGQLIAQLFSTADGYRRCQPSVIGEWYKLVELKFRWSSFRYEVKVTTPHFEIRPMADFEERESFLLDQNKPLPEFPWSLFTLKSRYLAYPWKPAPLLGTQGSRRGTFSDDRRKFFDSTGDDVPTWVALLNDAHSCQSVELRLRVDYNVPPWYWNSDIAPICITRKTRSWDFMPPDIVRPVSSTTVGDLITMAYRLGMIWSDFRLDEGKMRASGNGRSFSASIVRGMGLVVEYSGNGSYRIWDGVDSILSVAADKMTCGIIPAKRNTVRGRDLLLRTTQSPQDLELKQPFSVLDIYGDAKIALEASLSHPDPAHRLPAFTDVMGLWGNWILLESLGTNKIDNPFPFPLTTMGERPESRHVWRSELRKQESSLSDTRKRVLQFYDDWELHDPQRFVNNYRLYTTSDRQFTFFKKAFDDTTAYFDGTSKAIDPDFSDRTYELLISAHISVNAHSVEQAEKNVKNKVVRENDSLPDSLDPIFKERAYIYAENVPKFVEGMKRSRFHDPKKNISYEDIWWILMMRLHAWTMSVNWVDDRRGVKIPSEHYYSPARVYIL
ncbi:unnamed protein product [Alternaria burnsii]|nr:unnamed protein product [Alternaria burnsii]